MKVMILKRDRFVLLFSAAASIVILLFVLVGCPSKNAVGFNEPSVLNLSESFTVAATDAGPLMPGTAAPLDLIVTNPYAAPMSVTGFSIALREINAPKADDAHPCRAADFIVQQAPDDLEIVIAGQATRALSSFGVPRESWPRVSMVNRPVNQDGCKGATLTLDYAAAGKLEG